MPFSPVLAEDAIKAALHDYRLKQDGKIEAVKASNWGVANVILNTSVLHPTTKGTLKV